MKLETKKLLDKYCKATDTAIDWMIASWQTNNPYEKRIRELRHLQYREKSGELARKLYASTK